MVMCLQPGRDALMNSSPVPLPITAGARPWPPGDVVLACPGPAIPAVRRPCRILGYSVASVALWSRAEARQHAH